MTSEEIDIIRCLTDKSIKVVKESISKAQWDDPSNQNIFTFIVKSFFLQKNYDLLLCNEYIELFENLSLLNKIYILEYIVADNLKEVEKILLDES